jgi:hypothetical protein
MFISAYRNCSRLAKTCGPLCHPGRCRRENDRLSILSSPATGMLDTRGSRRFDARLPLALSRESFDAINAHGNPSLTNAREHTCLVVARELLASKGLSDETYAAAEKVDGAGKSGGVDCFDWQLFDDLYDG